MIVSLGTAPAQIPFFGNGQYFCEQETIWFSAQERHFAPAESFDSVATWHGLCLSVCGNETALDRKGLRCVL
jgi:hypothetical protein